MWVEMKVRGLALDPVSNMPIIILRDEEEKRSLPIWVGIFERGQPDRAARAGRNRRGGERHGGARAYGEALRELPRAQADP